MSIVNGVAQNEGDANALLSWPTAAALALLEMIRGWPKPDCAFHELSPAWSRDNGPGGVSMGLALRELVVRELVGACRDSQSGLVSCLEAIDEEKVQRYLGESEVKVSAAPRSRLSALAARLA